jgi:hypothetical protein
MDAHDDLTNQVKCNAEINVEYRFLLLKKPIGYQNYFEELADYFFRTLKKHGKHLV